jgi:hypothetical protein
LSFDFVPYNYNLKKDLQKICSKNNWEWANPSHPAYQYLFGQPKPPSHDVLFLGAFFTDPPNASQASALKHAQENPLTAVSQSFLLASQLSSNMKNGRLKDVS